MSELARPAALNLEPTNLNEVLTQALELYEEQASTQGVKVAREFDQVIRQGKFSRKLAEWRDSGLLSDGIVTLLDGGVEGVEVGMEDRHEHMFARAGPARGPVGDPIHTPPRQGSRAEVV